MKPETANSSQVAEALEALRRELARLGERVAALEGAIGAKPDAPAVAAAAQPADAKRPAEAEGLSEELVLVISAAIAAFLGKRPHIRQIRLLGSAAWAQQGRTTIQASHALPVKHG
jgi:methylmalonyl-CoA carboxyltransferase large subunit